MESGEHEPMEPGGPFDFDEFEESGESFGSSELLESNEPMKSIEVMESSEPIDTGELLGFGELGPTYTEQTLSLGASSHLLHSRSTTISSQCKVQPCLAEVLPYPGEVEIGESGFCKKCLTGYHLVTLRKLQDERGIDNAMMSADLRKRGKWDRDNQKVPCVCDDPEYEDCSWHGTISSNRRRLSGVEPDELLLRCQWQDRAFRVCSHCIALYSSIATVLRDYFYFLLPLASFSILKFKCIETMYEYTNKPWRNGQP
jgi:hypothetical protein